MLFKIFSQINTLKPFIDQHKIKIKFLLVGCWNGIFGILIFIVLYKLFSSIFHIEYLAYTSAQVLGTILAVLNAYIFHKYITFGSKVKGKKMVFEFLKFSTTYTVLFFLGLGVLPFLIEILKIKPIPASILLNILVIVSSYFSHSKFSFRH